MRNKPLTLLASQGGCAAKVGPRELYQILDGLSTGNADRQSILRRNEDAGCAQLSQDVAIVQSIDAITPVSDSPTVYGAVAVEHALGDIYAVGAKPVTGLFMLGFPVIGISPEVVQSILQGAINRLSAAGATLLKGHTIGSKQLELGVAVTGLLRGYLISSTGCRDGDALTLTKPLGSGIITTALKLANSQMPIEKFSMEVVENSERVMLESNSMAAEAMLKVGVHACTDVSGFGLIGHLHGMLTSSGLSATINFRSVPLIPGVMNLASQDLIPSGSERNAAYWWNCCEFDAGLTYAQRMLLFDAQTSGGLLISLANVKANYLLRELKNKGVKECAVIGHILKKERSTIIVTS
jgi:selenide,water dikinase